MNTTVPVLFVSVVYSNFSYRMTNSCNKDLRIWTVSGDPGTSILNSIDLHSNTLSFSINQFLNGSDNLFLIVVSVMLVVIIIIVVVVFFFSSVRLNLVIGIIIAILLRSCNQLLIYTTKCLLFQKTMINVSNASKW